MRLPRQKKLNTVSEILRLYTNSYNVLTMAEFVRRYKVASRTQMIESKEDFLTANKAFAESK